MTRGAQSSEFVLTVLTVVAVVLLAALGRLDESTAAILTGLSASYTLSRGYVKGRQGEAPTDG